MPHNWNHRAHKQQPSLHEQNKEQLARYTAAETSRAHMQQVARNVYFIYNAGRNLATNLTSTKIPDNYSLFLITMYRLCGEITDYMTL